MQKVIGFIGLGNMGVAMAANLQKAGYALRVYNRSVEKAKTLVQNGAVLMRTPAEVAQSSDIIITMVSDDQALESLVLGREGFGPYMNNGKIHLSMSTVSPGIAERLGEYHESQGGWYVAAPVFGKPEAAEAAKLSICVAGPLDAIAQVRPLLDVLGQKVVDFGQNRGAANVVKLSGNFLIAAAIEAMAEAYTLAEKSGISRTKVHELFSTTLFACPVYQNYGKMIAAKNYLPLGASPSLIRKDIRLALETADKTCVPMPLAHLVFQRLSATVAKGRDNTDWTGFAREVSEESGLN